ncbi:MAG: ABC transporter permease [Trueperaceae bacterium]
MLLQNIRTAFDALFNNRLRSFLTLLGVVIGVFAVTTTISMGAIATAGITDELQSFGSQSLFVVINQDDPLAPPLTDDDIDALSRLPIDILKQQSTQGTVRIDDKDVFLTINGTTANAIEVDRSLELARGRYFSEDEDRRTSPVIVLSADAAEDLFPDNPNPIGEEITVTFNEGESRQNYTVIGVKERISGTLGSFANDSSGDIPLETFYANFPFVERGEYVFFPITVALDKNIDDVRSQVESILERRRDPESYNIQTIEGALTLFNTITTILQVVLGGIGAISLIVGGIGILNIMLVSVTERTREIGLRKALGAKKATILQQFLIEAVVLTFIGGLIGVVLSVASLYLIVAAVPFVDRVIINPLVILLAFGVSVATGIIFGVWPASRAANLSPIEALRYE